jgi:hypothetical protein
MFDLPRCPYSYFCKLSLTIDLPIPDPTDRALEALLDDVLTKDVLILQTEPLKALLDGQLCSIFQKDHLEALPLGQ